MQHHNTKNKTSYDIIIVGAGIVGLSFAHLLAQSTLRIAIVDSKPLKKILINKGYDARVYAITPGTVRSFNKMQCWDTIAQQRLGTFREMHVWDENGAGRISFNAQDIGEAKLGNIIEHRVIINALLQQLTACPNVSVLAPLSLQRLSITTDEATLLTDDNQTLQAKLIIGADGGNSWVRTQANFPINESDYGHHALATTVKTAKPHQNVAWQRFLSDGPLAFLPLDDPHYCSIVWSAPPQHIAHLKSMPEEHFRSALTRAFDMTLGEIRSIAPRFSFPLTKRHAKKYVKSRIALIGDAAHTIHPLAGQGLNLGVADADALADIIIDALKHDRDFYSLPQLRRFERARKTQMRVMFAVTDGFKNGFTNQNTGLQYLRNLGLSFGDHLPPFKQFIMRKVMGL